MSLNAQQINDAYLNVCNFYSLMRGIHFAVYITALSKIYTRPAHHGQSKAFMAAIITILFILATADHARYWAYVRYAFIVRGQTAESIAEAINEYPAWFTGMIAFSDANAIIADGVIIWRTWVIWGRSWKVVVVPILCTIMTTVFSIVALYRVVAGTRFGALQVDYATALYSTSLVTTLFCTSAIVYRIVSLSLNSHGGMGLRSYRGILEILIESSALYFVATLFVLIAYIYSGPASEVSSAFWSSITGIAPTLLVARAASTDSRNSNTWTVSKPSVIQFGPSVNEESATQLNPVTQPKYHFNFGPQAKDSECGFSEGAGRR